MDVVWLVLDSLGYLHSSFSPDGPDTTPKVSQLADKYGIIFDNAYVPGPASPSSHGSFFTGCRPSETGMHEAYPYFDNSTATVADRLDSSHSTYLTSVNPFLFNGLNESFDDVDDLAAQQFLVFPEATNPRDFGERINMQGWQKSIGFLRQGKPLRSLINGIVFKTWIWRGNGFTPKSVGDANSTYQYAPDINERILSYRRNNSESFIIANYMDVHPPFNASDEAIQQTTTKLKNELPIGVRAEDIEEYREPDMISLYHAAIRDLDRQIAPLIETLIENNTFIVLTADHGPRFKSDHVLTEDRLHVPLVIFSPAESQRRVEHTVNLQSLPRTTMAALDRNESCFPGENLLSVTSDQLSVTEHIHTPSDDRSPVNPFGDDNDVAYDLYLREGDASVTLMEGDILRSEGNSSDVERLTDIAKEMLNTSQRQNDSRQIEYDTDTEQRLQDLGYL